MRPVFVLYIVALRVGSLPTVEKLKVVLSCSLDVTSYSLLQTLLLYIIQPEHAAKNRTMT